MTSWMWIEEEEEEQEEEEESATTNPAFQTYAMSKKVLSTRRYKDVRPGCSGARWLFPTGLPDS
jgi:hypothetical protein